MFSSDKHIPRHRATALLWRMCPVAALIVFCGMNTALSVMVGEFSIEPLGTRSGLDSGLTADTEGGVWFIDPNASKIGHVSSTGAIRVFSLPSGGELIAIATGHDGNIWYLKIFGGGVVGRLEKNGTATEFPAGMDYPRRMAAGPDGRVWFTGHDVDGRRYIAKISTTGSLTRFPLPISKGSPVGITAGPDGNLWFAVTGENKIGRTSVSGNTTLFSIGNWSFDITSGPDGNIWFTETDSIGCITPDGKLSEFKIPSPGSSVYGIAPGPDGNLWYTNYGNNRIGRITPSGQFLPELETPSPISAPQQITSSPDGLVWFAYSNYNKIGVAWSENIPVFFPLNDGTQWEYLVNGSDTSAVSVSPGVFLVNGIPTKRLLNSDGYQTFYTNDVNGVREHKEYDPEPPALTAVLSPPLIFADAQSAIGIPRISSGVANVFMDEVSYSLPYSASSTIQGFERIKTPAGVFDAVKATLLFSIGDVSTTQTYWLSKDIGRIKSEEDTDTFELKSTSIADGHPDRFWFVDQTGVKPGDMIFSNIITVTGITIATRIEIAGGEYQINNGDFTSSSGTVSNGDRVTLRIRAPSSKFTSTRSLLTIGDRQGVFRVTTQVEMPTIITIIAPLLLTEQPE